MSVETPHLSWPPKPSSFSLICLLLGALFVSGCERGDADVQTEQASVVVLGDSIMAWNEEAGQSVGHAMEEALGYPVERRAVVGARFDDPYFADDSIPAQLPGEAWDWVVFDWGGNDVNDGCECLSCDALLADLLDLDGQEGQVADFVTGLRAGGSRVIIVTYYDLPEDALYGFDACGDELKSIRERSARLAERLDGVFVYDLSALTDAEDLDAYDPDRVHPSARTSTLAGQGIAEMIRGLH